MHIPLRQGDVTINLKKTQRLYLEEGLKVRRKMGLRRGVCPQALGPVLVLSDQCWGLDFVHDQLATGRSFRAPNVVDTSRANACGP